MSDYRSLVIVSGVTRQIANGDRVVAPSGVVSSGANLTLEAAATYAIDIGTSVATQVNVGSGAAPVSVVGLLYANTLDRATAGALTIGGTNATSVAIGQAGVPVTAAGGILTTSVGRSSAGTLAIGTDANTTAITVGGVGVLTTVAGDLQVNGAETIIGITTFTGDAQFDGNVVFGNAVTDTVAFQSVIGNGTYNDLIFRNGNTHTIKAAAAAAGAGGIGNTMRYLGGDGAPADATTPGGAGGYADFRAGTGGAGTATQIAGAGRDATLKGGDAGVNGGAGGASGGDAIVNGGLGTNLTHGVVRIGALQTSHIYLGPASGTATPITQQSAAAITLNGPLTLNNTTETVAEFRTTSRLRLGETTTPSTVANNGFLYTKDVSGIPELFWRDDTNAELQVTINGQLNVAASTSAPKVVFTGIARTTISAGAPVCLNYDGANSGVFNADADGAGTGTQRCIGLADAATTATNPAYVVTNGEKSTADAIWDAVPAVTDVGKPAYLSENVGKLTMTAPANLGSVVQVVGTIAVGGTGNVAVLVQPQAPVLL